MEQMFQRHRIVLFSEMREFSFYSQKTAKSFFKIVWLMAKIVSMMGQIMFHFVFESQALYRQVSPGKKVMIDRPIVSHKPWMNY